MTVVGTAVDSTRDRASTALDRLERALHEVARGVFANTGMRSDLGIDKAGYFLLSELERSGTLRVSDVAARLRLDVSTVSRQLHVLEDLGLIRRGRDPEDGRAYQLEVTAEGEAELAALRDARHRVLGLAMAELDDDEREPFISSMEKLAAKLSGGAQRR
ncbi:MAG: marR family transcriptional regulator [Acidimicrobiaceae bacterium]|nr:marR family transcriptional regulator [Acidimicrobiaceae bacterium]